MVNDNTIPLSSPDSKFSLPLSVGLVSPKPEMLQPDSKPEVVVSMVLGEDKTEIIETDKFLYDDFNEERKFSVIKQEKECTITNLTCKPPNDHPTLKLEVGVTQELAVNIAQADLEKLSKDTKSRKKSAKLQNAAIFKPRPIKSEDSNDVETDIYADNAENSDWIIKNEEVHIKYEEGDEDDPQESSAIGSSRKDNEDEKCQLQQSKKGLARPSKTGRKLGQRIHHCTQCGYETSKLDLFKRHIIVVHEKGEGLKKHSCSRCTFETLYKHKLTQHIRRHNGDVVKIKFQSCRRCEYKTSRINGLPDHVCDKGVFTCYDCGYQTLMKNNLRKHVSLHTKKVAFNCNLCSFESKYKAHFRIHMLRHNTNYESFNKYKCTKCDYQTSQRYNLTRHGLVHKANKNATTYSCYHCDFRTYLKSSLKRHILRHNKRDYEAAKTIKCSECNYKCFQRWDLKLHLLRHKIGVPTKKCDRCEYSTTRNSSLTKHKLIHNRK